MKEITYTANQVNHAARNAENAAGKKHALLALLERKPSDARLRAKYEAACARYEKLADIAHAYTHGLPL